MLLKTPDIGSTPWIPQERIGECALACLAMVAGHHRLPADLPALRTWRSPSPEGATLRNLIDLAGRLGLHARPLCCEPEHLGRIALPAILHWNGNHFVVLAEIGKLSWPRRRFNGRRFRIHDPARGVRILDDVEVARHFAGAVLELKILSHAAAGALTSAVPPRLPSISLVGGLRTSGFYL